MVLLCPTVSSRLRKKRMLFFPEPYPLGKRTKNANEHFIGNPHIVSKQMKDVHSLLLEI